ncbi:MAG: nuclear transport factor 2 family protein [Nitriliruptor sp.]|nr:MAG: nuclear transport factor 2 family protein [Nitriliruptor sp.]
MARGIERRTPPRRTDARKASTVGHAATAWERISSMLSKGDVSELLEVYTADALYLEPYNPPHRGNLLIQAYLKDWLGGKEDIAVEAKRVIESEDGTDLGVEWTISYTAAGRRWNDLPRASFFAFDDDGRVVYHRDYT